MRERTPTRPATFFVLAILALAVGVSFVGVAVSVATKGTGAHVPRGEGVVEGLVANGSSVRSPAGRDFLYGEVRITQPGGSAAVDHSWSTPAGDPVIEVTTETGDVAIHLPQVSEWRGVVPVDGREVQDLDGLPIVSEATDVEQRMQPPYAIVVRAIRSGDAVVAHVHEGEVVEFHVGSRAQLERDLAERESMRWPIVGLMGVMGLASLGLGLGALRRGRGA